MDIKLNYTEKGSGDTLILLHGNGEDSEYFSSQIEYFSSHYRVIAVDTRWHGKSPRGSAPFTLEQFGEDLYGFMKDKGVDSAHIAGFSDGGNIAVLFALAHPTFVKSLVLCGANLYPDGLCGYTRFADAVGLVLFSALGTFSASARRRAALIRLMTDEPHIDPASLARISVPTLVMAGDRDLIKRSHTELIAASLPNSQMCILKGGHSLAAEHPDEFNRAVHKFLCAQG